MDAGPAVSARSMLGFPPFPLSFYPEQDRPGKDVQPLPEGGKGRSQSFSHNSKTRHALKTRTSFPSLPLTHLVAKPDLTQQETVNGRWDPALTPGVAILDLSLYPEKFPVLRHRWSQEFRGALRTCKPPISATAWSRLIRSRLRARGPPGHTDVQWTELMHQGFILA